MNSNPIKVYRGSYSFFKILLGENVITTRGAGREEFHVGEMSFIRWRALLVVSIHVDVGRPSAGFRSKRCGLA